MAQKTLTTDALVAKIATSSGFNLKQTRAVLSALTTAVGETLGDGIPVTIPGIVRLTPKLRAARVGHNPRTMQPVDIPATVVITARAVPSLRPQV